MADYNRYYKGTTPPLKEHPDDNYMNWGNTLPWIKLKSKMAETSNPVGYHSRKIEKGVLGESSKIREEFEEFEDALILKNPVMALVELCDMIGAIEAYAQKHHSISLDQLINMKDATKRAFEQGHRK